VYTPHTFSVSMLQCSVSTDLWLLAFLPARQCISCVCLSVSHASIVSQRLNVGSRKQRYVIAQGLLVFWRQQSLVDDPLPPEISAQSDPPTFQTAQFRQISAHSASTVRAGERSSISTNRKSTTRFPTSHRWTVYVNPNSPKGWHKTRFCCFCQ